MEIYVGMQYRQINVVVKHNQEIEKIGKEGLLCPIRRIHQLEETEVTATTLQPLALKRS
jgi:hypothetical protein